MKKFYLVLMMVVALCASAYAEDMYMHIVQRDGSVKVLNIDQVGRLTFKDGTMTATDKSGATIATVGTATVYMLGFNEDGSDEVYASVDEALAAEQSLAFDGSRIIVNGENATDVVVYSVAGEKVVAIPAVAPGTPIDLAELAAGVYVVKAGDVTVKIAVK